MPQTDEDLAVLLTTARRNNTTIGRRDEIVPASLKEAYEVSARVAKALDEEVMGWKVGVAADNSGFGGSMLASGFRESGGEWRRRSTGPLLVEIEIALRLGRDLPARPGRPYSRAEVVDACASALVGFEMIESRFGDMAGLPFFLSVADDVGNAGYVVGDEVTDFRMLDLANLRCRLWTDEELTSDRLGGHPKGDPWLPVIAWANDQCDRLGGMKAGQVITTGALVKPVRLERPARMRATIDGLGDVAVDVF